MRFGWVTDGDLIARKLRTFDEVICAAPSYLAQASPITDASDLARHEWIGYTGFGPTTQTLQIRDPAGRQRRVLVECRVRTSNAPSQRQWALAALGLTRLPLFVVAPDLAAGDLVRVLPEFRLESPSLYAMYLADPYRPAAAKALLAHVIAELDERRPTMDRKAQTARVGAEE